MVADDTSQTFRPPVWLVYLGLSISTQFALVSIFSFQIYTGYTATGQYPAVRDWLLWGITFALCGATLLPVSAVLAHRNRVRVGPFGMEIRCWGARRIIDWRAMENVEVVKSLGWRSLRIRTIAGRMIWLPVHVANREEYRDAVAHFAGEDHPVARALAAAASPS